jgi:hypothetical protein
MPIFKYTVANKEDRKLVGSIEAPDEKTARTELNSLGFSILELKETSPDEIEVTERKKTKLTPGTKHSKFVFESINPQGQVIVGTISANDEFSAFKRLTLEYELTVTSVWSEEASEEEIREAKSAGVYQLQQTLTAEKEGKKVKEAQVSQGQRKKEILTRTKIEQILKQVNEILIEYEKDITPAQRKEIDKRIDKLLRIKHSTNFDYIIQTAEDLLTHIQKQEINLKKQGYLEKRAKLKLQVRALLNRLHDTGKSKSISEDIVTNIQNWQQKNISRATKVPWHIRVTNRFLLKIRKMFETPAEVELLKAQIKTYNSQIIEYIKIYFKEPTAEYKERTVQAIKTIWKTRKKAVQQLKDTKKRIKEERQKNRNAKSLKAIKQEFTSKIFNEITEFTGWLLTFYLTYYFISLYVTSKDFGLGSPANLPKSLNFYNTEIFKYVLVIVFLSHIAFTLKTNFFNKTKGSSYIIFPLTGFLIIFTIVNF